MFNDMTYEEVYDKYIQPQKIQAFNDGYEKGRADTIDECMELCRRMHNTYFTDDWLRTFASKLNDLKEHRV